jgi:hypothetical protein
VLLYGAANLWYETLELKHVLALTKEARCCREETLELKHAIAVRKEVSKEVSKEVRNTPYLEVHLTHVCVCVCIGVCVCVCVCIGVWLV